MEENQTNQNNLNQQPVQQAEQAVQQQTQQVQQEQQNVQNDVSVSMQIQQLLVQQQQYQQQYNQLVDYVKQTPNLPIEQVNQIKLQLDQLNALFVQWKQKLQALWYTQVQVNKPTEVKKWAKSNFSFRKLAIWCGIVVVLILAWFFVTLSSLIKNPQALQWIWVNAAMAKTLLQAFTWLLFWSIIILMLWVIISNIYRLITVKNQSKGRFVLWLFWWLLWAWIIWFCMWQVFWMIGKIVTEVAPVDYDIVQPYLVWRVEKVWNDEFLHPYKNSEIHWIGTEYDLIAPAEMAFSLRVNEFNKYLNENKITEYENLEVTLSCWNNTNRDLSLMKDDKWNYIPDGNWWYKFQWTCLYDSVWKYEYSINVSYDNKLSKERNTKTKSIKSLKFDSEISIYKSTITSSSSNNKPSRLKSNNWEFDLWKAPAKITIDSAQVFTDFGLQSYDIERDMDGDFVSDRTNQTSFNYSYKIPKVYYVTYKFPWLSDDTWYRFPVRVYQSDTPVCEVNVARFPWTTKYQITADFVDASSVATISSYNYSLRNVNSKWVLAEFKNHFKEFTYTFPTTWSYVVVLDYVTIDWKQGQCESDIIELEKEMFNVQYTLLEKDEHSWKFVDLCNSTKSEYNNCTQIDSNILPQSYQLHIDSIKPNNSTTKKVVYLNDNPLLNEDDTYSFDALSEWTYNLKIVVSDSINWVDDKIININIVIKKRDVVWKISILSADTRKDVSEWFEPLSVILDASKTEINVPWDEIVYFSWDFGDGEIKQNQQNGVVSHVYNFDYKKENWIFQPKVTIKTREWLTETIVWPKLNVKKGLIHIDLSSSSHPSMQAQVWKDVLFQAEFDWLPEKMIWDFGDGTPSIECKSRTCTEIAHTFDKVGLFSVKLTLIFDAIQQVDWSVDFKIY